MTSSPAPHWVLKDVVPDPSENPIPVRASAQTLSCESSAACPGSDLQAGACVRARARVVVPRVPALFLLIESIETPTTCPVVRGVQFVEDQRERFHYVNLPPWSFEFAAGRKRRTLLTVQLPDDTAAPVRILYADGTGRYQSLGELTRNETGWKFVPATAADLPVLPFSAPLRRPQYFFVGGTPKSGTTWVEKILNSHPQTLCLGQGGFFEPVVPPVLSEGLNYDQRNFLLWDLPNRRRGIELDDYLMGKALLAFQRHESLWPGLAAIGDRSPGNSLAYQKIHDRLEDCRMIHCVRHPLDVVVSRLYHEWNLFKDGQAALCCVPVPALARLDGKLQGTGNELQLDSDDAELFEPVFDEWIQLHELALKFRAAHPELILMVHYEQLLSNFERIADSMFQFLLGRPLRNRAELEMIAELSSFKFLSGGRSRGTAEARSFFRQGMADDYRGRFSPPLLDYARRKVGKLAGEFGFEIEG